MQAKIYSFYIYPLEPKRHPSQHYTSRGRQREKMHNTQRGAESFVIQVKGGATQQALDHQTPQHTIQSIKYFNFSAMKLFHRFRKVIMRLMFSLPSRHSSSSDHSSRHGNSDRFEPPKTSCSSYYSSYSHYNEAIADCIEFFNKSAQDGILDGRKSDVV